MIMISTGRGASRVILAPGTDIFRRPGQGSGRPAAAARGYLSGVPVPRNPAQCLSRVQRARSAFSSASTSASWASHPLGLPVVRAHALHEPARDRRRHHAEQRDPGHHQRARDDAALDRDRVAVAVADRGDRRDRPPQRVAERGDRRVRGVPLGVEHGERGDEPDERDRARDVERHPAARVVAQLPVEHAEHGDQPEDPQLAEHRQEQDRQVGQVAQHEPHPTAGQADPDQVVEAEHHPDAGEQALQRVAPRRGDRAVEHRPGVGDQEDERQRGERPVSPAVPSRYARLVSRVGEHAGQRKTPASAPTARAPPAPRRPSPRRRAG